MKLAKAITVILFVFILFSLSSFAEEVSSGDIILKYTIPFGGSEKMTDQTGEITLYDMKGQPVIGESDDGTGKWGGGNEVWPSYPSGTVTGTVTDVNTNDPIDGVAISTDSRSTVTAADGTYTLVGVPAGAQVVTASKTYYETQQRAANVLEGQTTVVDFILEPYYGQSIEEEGDVILTIQKEAEAAGSNILVDWRINPESGLPAGNPIDVYWINGTGNVEDGNGIFSNDPADWRQIVDDSSVPNILVSGVRVDHANRRIVLEGLVASDPQEIYIRALPAGDPVAELAKELAVGKLNVELKGQAGTAGKNLISIPFRPQPGPTVAEVFGEGAGTVWEEGDRVQSKFSGSPAYFTAVYSDNIWKNAASAADPPNFTIDYRFGNWVLVNSDKTISVVGKVVNIEEVIALYSGAGLSTGGKTLVGMTHPRAIGLSGTSLLTDGAAEGDLMQYKVDPLAPAYISAVVAGGQWTNAVTGQLTLDPLIGTMTLPNSYIYVRKSDTGFFWYKERPY